MRWWIVAAVLVLVGRAEAESLKRPLAKGGDWAAIAHVSAGAPVACIAIDPTVGVALRADTAGITLMVQNLHWDFPAHQGRTIRVVVGAEARSFPVTGILNGNDTVAARMAQPDAVALLSAMAKAAAMRVTVGQTMPLTASLVGSAAVLAAFRRCARIG